MAMIYAWCVVKTPGGVYRVMPKKTAQRTPFPIVSSHRYGEKAHEAAAKFASADLKAK